MRPIPTVPRLLALAAAFASALLGAAIAAQASWHEPVVVATGGGERGPWRQNDSRYDYVDDPSLALTPNGEAAVVWVDQSRKDVRFRRFDGAGKPLLERPIDVSRSPGTFSWLPRVALGPRDEVYVLWQEIIFSGGSHGGDILFARSGDGGASFSEPINLSKSRAGDGKGRIDRDRWHNGSLDIAVTPDATIYAAWTEYEGRLWLARSMDGGRSFTSPRHVAGDERLPARGPSLAVGSRGHVLLAWTVGEDRGADIHVARSDDGGERFSSPIVVAPNRTYSDAPKIAVDGNGLVHLAFGERVGGPFDAYRVLYARSTDGGRSFEAPRDISSPMPDGMGSAAFPSMALDGKGGVYVSWELARGARDRPTSLGLGTSHDGGASFAAPVQVPGSGSPEGGTNGSHQGFLMKKLAVNGQGDVALVNSTLIPGQASRVWIVRGRVAPR